MIPEIDLYEEEDEYVIEADLPGLSPAEVEVDVTPDCVIIRGRRRHRSDTRAAGKTRLHRKERRSGRFERSIPLPHPVLLQAAQATLESGVLRVKLLIAKRAPPAQRLPVQPSQRAGSRHLELARG